MSASIKITAICEVRSVIRVLLAKNDKPIEIHHELCEVYVEDVMTESYVRHWCLIF